MNMGRPLGRMGRWLLRPTAIWMVWGMLVTVAPLLWQTRPPAGWGISWVNLKYPWTFRDAWACWRREMLDFERVTAIAALGLAIVITWWTVALVLRVLAVAVYRQPRAMLRQRAARDATMAMLAILGVALVLVGWPYRVVRSRVLHDELLRTNTTIEDITAQPAASNLRSVSMSPHHRLLALQTGMRWLPHPRERAAAMILIRQDHPKEFLAAVRQAMQYESQPHLIRAYLQLLGLLGSENDLPAIAARLSDPNATIRATAANGIALLCGAENRNEVLSIPFFSMPELALRLGPIEEIAEPRDPQTTARIPEAVRTQLEQMMTTPRDYFERQAAARAVSMLPQRPFDLRLSEWRVWCPAVWNVRIQPQLRISLQREAFESDEAWDGLKPMAVLRFEADRALAVRLKLPDVASMPGSIYPLRDDAFNYYGWRVSGECDWMSLFVAPVMPPTTNPARLIATDPMATLPGSQIANGAYFSDAVYIEGGGQYPAPVRAVQVGDSVRVIDVRDGWRPERTAKPGEPSAGRHGRSAVVLRVRGQEVEAADLCTDGCPTPLPHGAWPARGKEAVQRVARMLVEAGMTNAEAAAFVAACHQPLLGGDGLRAVVRLSAEEYQRLCPLQIHPAPTRSVRVGIVITSVIELPDERQP